MVPAPFHTEVAKACIQFQKNMITASYVSPAMRDLHTAAADAGVVLLNELGLDPGIGIYHNYIVSNTICDNNVLLLHTSRSYECHVVNR